jgi:TonB family protein
LLDVTKAGVKRTPRQALLLSHALLLSVRVASAQPAPAPPGQPPAPGAPAPVGPATAPAAGPGAPTPAPAAPSGVVPPQLITFVEAAYPAEAQAQGLTADVVLRLRVEADGSVSEVDVMTPAGNGFDEAAVAAARRFVFSPATVNGKAVAVKIPFKYSFTLSEQLVEQAPPTQGELAGKIQVAGADTPLVGARISARDATGKELTTVTAADGSWTLGELTPGRYRVKVEASGFSSTELEEEVVAGEATELTYRMSADVGDAIEVSVYGERPPREVLRRTITRREMTRVPGTGGDALRSLQNLPGLARPPGLAGLLIVRGSAPEDSAVFVDGDTVPFIYHFGGISSAIPTELLERIDFYPGNFSARYGRVMGGIVDVAMREPDTTCRGPYGQPSSEKGCFHGLAQVDLIDARVLVQGPLPIDGWTFAIGGRRSWVDAWLKPVLREAGAGVTTAPVYYDYQLIAETKPTRNSRLSLRLLGSDDALEVLIENPAAQDPGAFGGSVRFGTSFYRIQALLDMELARDITLTSLVSFGQDKANFSLGRFRFDLQSYNIQTREEFSFRFSPQVTLNAGIDFQVAPFELLVRLPEPPRPGEPSAGPLTTRPLLETRAEDVFFRPAWYADALLRFGKLTVTPGLRLDYARDTGHSDLSPRLTARYDLSTTAEHADGSMSRRTTLKAGAGVFHQPAQPQETDEVFGTPGLRSNRALHYAIGLEREVTENVEINIEGFYKDLDRLVSRTAGLDGGFAYDTRGSGSVIGAETLIKYKPDSRFFGWFAYTLSRSVRRDEPGAETYPFQFDQTHILTVLGSYKLGDGWEAGARFRLVSGPLDTPVLGSPNLPAVFAADAAAYTPLQAEPFSERLPLVHQLDLRVEKNWHLRHFDLTFYVDIWNAYNNAASEAFTYNFDYSRRSYQQGLPIIPSMGFRGEF